MEKLKSIKIKDILFYTFLFLLFLVWNLILSPVSLDEIWNYGFSHNIYSGLIPYKDFNMVITPFYPMFISLFFFIFGSSSLVMHVVNAVMLTFFSWLLTKLIGERTWVIVFFLFFFIQVAFPGYNIFLVMLFILLSYLEKKKCNDYLIGIVLAIAVLTKQSVGVCLLLISLYYWKDKKKLLKRFIGFLGPCLLFLIYLLCTNSFMQFLDLCLFGLFDFASINGGGFNIYWLFFIGMVIITIYFICNDKKNIVNYYGVAFYSVNIPMFDRYHTIIAFYVFLVVLLSNLKFNFSIKINGRLLIICVLIGMSIIVGSSLVKNVNYPNEVNHFEYRRLDNYTIEFTAEMNKFIKKNADKKVVFLNSNGYYFRLVNDQKITYLDLINDGNWGYNGSEKLYDTMINLKEVIYIVDCNELDEIYQTNKKIINYVIDNGTKLESIRTYDIYVIE